MTPELRYSSHMTEKDRGISFADRWRIIPKDVERPTLTDIRGRYYAIGGLLVAGIVTASALMGTNGKEPTPEPRPVVTTQHSYMGSYEQCLQAARTEVLIDPAQGAIAIKACEQAEAQNPAINNATTSTQG